jgi:ketosteroid isomerase-like protein
MKPPTPKEVINRWFEQVWNARDKSTIFAMMAEDAVAHLAGGAQACGIAQFSQFQETFLAAFPDLSVRILRSVGDETQACLTGRSPARLRATSPASPRQIEKFPSVA